MPKSKQNNHFWNGKISKNKVKMVKNCRESRFWPFHRVFKLSLYQKNTLFFWMSWSNFDREFQNEILDTWLDLTVKIGVLFVARNSLIWCSIWDIDALTCFLFFQVRLDKKTWLIFGRIEIQISHFGTFEKCFHIFFVFIFLTFLRGLFYFWSFIFQYFFSYYEKF